jgi:DNA-binding MarR family transcriptional regulator
MRSILRQYYYTSCFSNPGWLGIVLTHLAEKINATIQEAARHVNRLVEANLIERNPHDFYTLTTFGSIVLILITFI